MIIHKKILVSVVVIISMVIGIIIGLSLVGTPMRENRNHDYGEHGIYVKPGKVNYDC